MTLGFGYFPVFCDNTDVHHGYVITFTWKLFHLLAVDINIEL